MSILSSFANSQRQMSVGRLRAELVQPGDLRGEIGFQNDVNALVAALDEHQRGWSLAAEPMMSLVAAKRPARRANPNATTSRMKAFSDTREEAIPASLAG